MVSQFVRGHHKELDDNQMPSRVSNGHSEYWKNPDRAESTYRNMNNASHDGYTLRSNFSTLNRDSSRGLCVEAHLLAIIRIEDKRNGYYSKEVVNKLRQKEQAKHFINKPCLLLVTDHEFIIRDKVTQATAERIPLEMVDPTCVSSEIPDTLNDIFMYRLLDRHGTSTMNHASSSNSNELSTVIVFKCTNRESRLLVDSIRNFAEGTTQEPIRSPPQNPNGFRTNGGTPTLRIDPQPSTVNGPPQIKSPLQPSPHAPSHGLDYFQRLTEELNKCFDDIEIFVRHLESLVQYTKRFDRTHRRKDKKVEGAIKQAGDRLPDDKYFIDILQKFKYSFNLLGELKATISNPNAPELVHYLFSPLQFMLLTLQSKHPNQIKLAQEILVPSLKREAKELLINCMTSKEQDVLKVLGPAWIRTAEELHQRPADYRPKFFDGSSPWIQQISYDVRPTIPRSVNARAPSDRPQTVRSFTQLNSITDLSTNQNTQSLKSTRKSSPQINLDRSTMDRSATNKPLEVLNKNMQNEHAWAIERKREGAKICVVKIDRAGKNEKELSVRQGELVEILNDQKQWWRARNFQGETGHVPNNIVEEIDIEQRPVINVMPQSTAFPSRSPDVLDERSQSLAHTSPFYIAEYEQQQQQRLLRSPSDGKNFIMQSNNGTSMNPTMVTNQQFSIFPTHLNGSISVPPPAPPPLPLNLLTNRSSVWSTIRIPENDRKENSLNNSSLTPQIDELQQELTQRIQTRVGLINENSTREEVERWLQSKQVSPQIIKNLQGMNGKQLFELSKQTFDRFTNQNESNRIYTLILQQKQLSGYQSKDTANGKENVLNNAIHTLKSTAADDEDDHFTIRANDSLSRSLKLKLKQRRDKIEQSELDNKVDV